MTHQKQRRDIHKSTQLYLRNAKLAEKAFLIQGDFLASIFSQGNGAKWYLLYKSSQSLIVTNYIYVECGGICKHVGVLILKNTQNINVYICYIYIFKYTYLCFRSLTCAWWVIASVADVATYFGLSGIGFLVDSHASLLLLSRVEVSVVSAEYLWPLQDVAMKRYKSEVERERQCGETKFEGSFS